MNTYDVLVVGGGLTGVAAAIAAARQGMNVLLAEQSGFLGGAAGNCLVNPFMPNRTRVSKNGEARVLQLSAGWFSELVERLKDMKAFENDMFHEEYLKLALDRMTAEAGVHVLLHVTLCDVCVSEGHLRQAIFVGKGGKMSISARSYIDATGDADLAFMSGCPTRLGRDGDSLCQPMTLCFRIANVDIPLFEKNYSLMQETYRKFKEEGKISNPRENILIFKHPVDHTLHFNTTRVVKLNPTDPMDLTRAEMTAREQMFEMYFFLRDHIPGFANSQLSASAPQIGVRESRMIVGDFVLTAAQLKAQTRFNDVIATGNYDIDIHNPEGGGTSHYYFPEGQYYDIPYRCLLPRGADNLLVAGRCLSVDHEAQASCRIMPICACTGEAAGVAAAVAVKDSQPMPRVNIRAVQQILRDSGACLGDA